MPTELWFLTSPRNLDTECPHSECIWWEPRAKLAAWVWCVHILTVMQLSAIKRESVESVRLWCAIQGSIIQLHSANDQMTARVNMAFSRPQNYDSLHWLASWQWSSGPQPSCACSQALWAWSSIPIWTCVKSVSHAGIGNSPTTISLHSQHQSSNWTPTSLTSSAGADWRRMQSYLHCMSKPCLTAMDVSSLGHKPGGVKMSMSMVSLSNLVVV
jgi:hypothetical protein